MSGRGLELGGVAKWIMMTDVVAASDGLGILTPTGAVSIGHTEGQGMSDIRHATSCPLCGYGFIDETLIGLATKLRVHLETYPKQLGDKDWEAPCPLVEAEREGWLPVDKRRKDKG